MRLSGAHVFLTYSNLLLHSAWLSEAERLRERKWKWVICICVLFEAHHKNSHSGNIVNSLTHLSSLIYLGIKPSGFWVQGCARGLLTYDTCFRNAGYSNINDGFGALCLLKESWISWFILGHLAYFFPWNLCWNWSCLRRDEITSGHSWCPVILNQWSARYSKIFLVRWHALFIAVGFFNDSSVGRDLLELEFFCITMEFTWPTLVYHSSFRAEEKHLGDITEKNHCPCFCFSCDYSLLIKNKCAHKVTTLWSVFLISRPSFCSDFSCD